MNKINIAQLEIWKDVPEYGGYYQASTLGNIKSLDRIVWVEKRDRYLSLKGKMLKPKLNRNGYHVVVLCKDSERKDFSVHQIIAKTFIENINNYPDINHKNNMKTDNFIENLEWVTCQINHFKRWETRGRIINDRVINRKREYSEKMSNGHATKLNPEKVIEIRRLYATGQYTHADLGKMFNINSKYAYMVINRGVWKHI